MRRESVISAGLGGITPLVMMLRLSIPGVIMMSSMPSPPTIMSVTVRTTSCQE